MIHRHLIGICAISLVSACGDDLESRQAAVQQPDGDAITISQPNAPDAGSTSPRRSSQIERGTGQGGETDATEKVIVDAGPETFVDDAQGFSTDPIDDTSGFDPTPMDPQGFAPEPSAAEVFEE